MHSILLVVEKPVDIEIELIHKEHFCAELKTIVQKYKEIEVLGECVLLIKANEISCFAEVCAACIRAKHTYRAIFFEEEPQWVYSTTYIPNT